jgi:dienelactone hydrolase
MIIPDIFGFHPASIRLWDALAQRHNLAIIVPDFFDGKPWDHSRMPPDPTEFAAFQARASYEIIIPRIRAGVALLTDKAEATRADKARAPAAKPLKKGVTIAGFCWGAKVACRLSAEEPWVNGAALIHPSKRMVPADGQGVQCPIALMPSVDDTPMEELRAVIEAAGHLAAYIFADDVPHGFCGARFRPEPTFEKRVGEAFVLIRDLAI